MTDSPKHDTQMGAKPASEVKKLVGVPPVSPDRSASLI